MCEADDVRVPTTKPVWRLLQSLMARDAQSLKLRAWLDICGIGLPLVAAWILVLIAIPNLGFDVITDGYGRPITDGYGRTLTGSASQKSLSKRRNYFEWAIPAAILITLGSIIQARQAIIVVLGVAFDGVDGSREQSGTRLSEPEE